MLMKYRALKGFSGLISMKKGEVKEVPQKVLQEQLGSRFSL